MTNEHDAQCELCATVRDSTAPRLFPTHLVHPMSHEPRLWDVFGHGLCPTCYTVWRYNRDNSVEIVA